MVSREIGLVLLAASIAAAALSPVEDARQDAIIDRFDQYVKTSINELDGLEEQIQTHRKMSHGEEIIGGSFVPLPTLGKQTTPPTSHTRRVTTTRPVVTTTRPIVTTTRPVFTTTTTTAPAANLWSNPIDWSAWTQPETTTTARPPWFPPATTPAASLFGGVGWTSGWGQTRDIGTTAPPPPPAPVARAQPPATTTASPPPAQTTTRPSRRPFQLIGRPSW